METITDKLNKLIETKSAIKTAIVSKGVAVSDSDPFASYANKIASIEGGSAHEFDFTVLGYDEEECREANEVANIMIASGYTVEDINKSIDYSVKLYTGSVNGYISSNNIQAYFHPKKSVNQYASDIRVKYIPKVSYSSNPSSTASLIKIDTPLNLDTLSSFSFSGSISLIDIPELDTSNFTSFSSMFNNCISLNVDREVIFNAAKATDFSNMFYKSGYIKKVTFTNTSGVTNFDSMFYYSRVNEVSGIDFTNRNVPSSANSLPFSYSHIQTISNVKAPENAVYLFRDAQDLKNIYNLDTSNTTNFEEMFSGCRRLQQIPEIDTSKGTKFNGMFYKCYNITSLPQLDTSNGTNFGTMFEDCQSLESIPQLDTSKGTNFSYMFSGCTELIKVSSLSLKSLNTTISQSYFTGYSNMTKLRYVLLKDFGTGSGCTSASFTHWPNWGTETSNPLTKGALQSVRDSLITYSFDRVAAGYTNNCTITLSSETKALLTQDEIAQITTKGYTIA